MHRLKPRYTGLGALAAVAVAACSSENHASTSSDAGADAGASPIGCTSYWQNSIAQMRQLEYTECVELDNVVSLGVTRGPTYQLFVQDAAGGPGIRATCAASDTGHPCSASAAVAAIPAGHSITLKGFAINDPSGPASFSIDSVSDNGPTTMPAPLALSANAVAPQEPDSGLFGNDYCGTSFPFQRVTVTGFTNLVLYDSSPREFAVAGATQCPYDLGFALIDPSLGATASEACTGGASQPAGQTSPSSQEILIGTDFAPAFSASTDCQCTTAPLGVTAKVTKLAGILMAGQFGPQLQGFCYVAPQTDADVTFE